MNHPRLIPAAAAALLFASLQGHFAWADPGPSFRVPEAGAKNHRPDFLGSVVFTEHRGTDDLLTAGLGKAGLAAAAPTFANPLAPTAAELRRNAIHTNYRAVLDITAAGGYGTLYGPNVAADGTVTAGDGKVPGVEYMAYANDRQGRKNVTLLVQVPDSFDAARPCIVTAPSSGSRGIYGAIGASGEWGLKRGCAVAYTDKGTGNGLHDLQADTVNLIDGTRTTAAAAGDAAHFNAGLTAAERDAFKLATPDRVAYKHAHSQQNPETDWGRNVLQSIVFAFHALNEQFGNADKQGNKRAVFDRRNTLVIASGISNGGGASLRAAELDGGRLIDGVAVTEPNIQPGDTRRLRIFQGTREVPTNGKPLLDYFTVGNLYQPCAALAPAAAGSPAIAFLSAASAANRCEALVKAGMIPDGTPAERGAAALDKLHAYGWGAESDLLQASHYRFATNAIAVTYANAHGRFSVLDNLCGFSFANTGATGAPAPQNPVLQAGIFSTGNGVPPTTGVNVVFNDAVGGPRLDLLAVSASTGLADFAFDGALCHRALVTGRDAATGVPLMGPAALRSARVRQGIAEVQAEAHVRVPTIISHGRSDALVPVNHSSRAYVGKNLLDEGHRRGLRYIEVTNAQHFDTFIGSPVFAGYDTRFVPLHVYLNRSLDAMWEHLTAGKALPPSQVVRTLPRGGVPGAAPAITSANVPPIAAEPDPSALILMSGNALVVPE
jgi:hydroxybutyrate-dimer hydrolase